MRITLDLLIEDDRWIGQKFASKQYLKKVIATTLNTLNWQCRPSKITVCILLTHNAKMQELNYSFLGINKPTNVLAFPSENRDSNTPISNTLKILEMGDVALGYEILYKEAKQYLLELKDHFTHLIIHATLHTLGFDHITKEDEKLMYSIEDTVLAALDIKRCIRSPHIES